MVVSTTAVLPSELPDDSALPPDSDNQDEPTQIPATPEEARDQYGDWYENIPDELKDIIVSSRLPSVMSSAILAGLR